MKLLKDSTIYVIGGLISKAFPFLLLPYLTRKLGVEGFGELSISLMWLVLFTIFTGMSQEAALTRYFFNRGKKYVNLIFISGFIFSVLFSVPLILIGLVLQSKLFLLIIMASLFQTAFNVQLALRQCNLNSISYFFVQIANTSLSFLLTISFFEYIEPTANNRIFSIALANIITSSFACFWYFKAIGQKKVNLKYNILRIKVGIRYIFSFGAPLLLHNLSLVVKGQVDRFFVYASYSLVELGVYSAGYQVASIYLIFLSTLNVALIPYFYKALKEITIGIKDVWRLFRIAMVISPVPFIITIFIPESWFLIILGNEYEGVKNIALLFVLGMGFQVPYLILVNFLFFYGETKRISYCTLISSVVYILCVFLLSTYSLGLMPFGYIISNIVAIILLAKEVRKVGETNIIKRK
jgi:O-antigen/teichoic acid export membrane protein